MSAVGRAAQNVVGAGTAGVRTPSTYWSADRLARAGLSMVAEPGDHRVIARLATLDPGAEADTAWRDALSGRLGGPVADRARGVDLDRVRRRAELARIRFAVPGDDEWPEGLADLERAVDPERRVAGVPIGLWLRGPLALGDLCARAVSVVGARSCTSYGETVAADVASGLVDAGMAVISGGAYGIDVAAHRGALTAGGATAVVLASGVDVPYPRGHATLFTSLAQDHLLISELPPGSHPTRSRFLTRNRLIATLGCGVVVVEAAVRSGARSTANWASACGRPLMAVPGSIGSALSEGPHQLIREQQAVLVTSAAEVLEVVSPAGQHLLEPRRGAFRPTDRLTGPQLDVYDALRATRSTSTDEVADAAGLGVASALAELAALEDLGLVRADVLGWRLA